MKKIKTFIVAALMMIAVTAIALPPGVTVIYVYCFELSCMTKCTEFEHPLSDGLLEALKEGMEEHYCPQQVISELNSNPISNR